jgi:hypothetical protein
MAYWRVGESSCYRVVVLGTAGGERRAVASEGLGLNGEENEEVVLEQGRNDRSLAELDADGDGSAVKSGAELVGPVTESGWRVTDDGALALGGAGSAKADVVLLVGPVDADQGGKRNGVLHGGVLLNTDEGGHAEPDPAKAIRRAGASGCP